MRSLVRVLARRPVLRSGSRRSGRLGTGPDTMDAEAGPAGLSVRSRWSDVRKDGTHPLGTNLDGSESGL